MPKIEGEHTDLFWLKVEKVIVMILESDLLFKKSFDKSFTESVMEKFDVAERTATRYITEAKRKIRSLKKEITKKKIEHHFNKAIIDREWVIRAAKQNGDIKTALDGMKERDKLLDLYPDQKVKNENVNYDFDPSKFTDKGLERLKRGDDIQKVLLDPESVVIKK